MLFDTCVYTDNMEKLLEFCGGKENSEVLPTNLPYYVSSSKIAVRKSLSTSPAKERLSRSEPLLQTLDSLSSCHELSGSCYVH